MKSPKTLTLSMKKYLFLIAAAFALQASFASAKGDDLHFYYMKDEKCYQTNNSNPDAGGHSEVDLGFCLSRPVYVGDKNACFVRQTGEPADMSNCEKPEAFLIKAAEGSRCYSVGSQTLVSVENCAVKGLISITKCDGLYEYYSSQLKRNIGTMCKGSDCEGFILFKRVISTEKLRSTPYRKDVKYETHACI